MPGHPVRKRARLPEFDYASPGACFITVCTHQRACLFGEIVDGAMRLHAFGECARTTWLGIPRHFPDAEIVPLAIMPNHLHAILVLQPCVGAKHPELPGASPLHAPAGAHGTRPGSDPALVQNAKSVSTRKINLLRGTPAARVWQRGYYEHIIRTPDDLDRLRRYIESNALRWSLDQENPINA